MPLPSHQKRSAVHLAAVRAPRVRRRGRDQPQLQRLGGRGHRLGETKMTQGDHIGDESPPDPEQLSEHAAKASRRQTAWKEQECALWNRFYDRVHVNVARAGRRVEAKREQLQLEVDRVMDGPSVQQQPPPPSALQEGAGWGDHLLRPGQLRMVKWTCTCCSHTFSPHALD